jgi:hypothetical protein
MIVVSDTSALTSLMQIDRAVRISKSVKEIIFREADEL